MRSLKSWCK